MLILASPVCDLTQNLIQNCHKVITSTWVIHKDTALSNARLKCMGAFGICIQVASNIEVNITNTYIRSEHTGTCVSLQSRANLHLKKVAMLNCGGEGTVNGGAIRGYSHNPIEIECSTFVNSSATDIGGSIYGYNSKLIVNNTKFINNSVTTVSSSTSAGNGGAMWLQGGTAIIENCKLESNIATRHAGGLYFNYFTKAVVKDTEFISNKAKMGGGAIYTFYATNVTVINTKFMTNKAGTYGGAILSYVRSTLTTYLDISDSYFLNNYAGGLGGAIYSYNATIDITNTNLASNSGSRGGGLYLWNSPFLSNNVKSCKFNNNKASRLHSMQSGWRITSPVNFLCP